MRFYCLTSIKIIPPLEGIPWQNEYLEDSMPVKNVLKLENFEGSERYALTEICIGYEYFGNRSLNENIKLYSMILYRDDFKALTVPMLRGNIKLSDETKNVMKLSIALTKSYMSFQDGSPGRIIRNVERSGNNIFGFDMEVKIRCIKNTITKGLISEKEEDLYNQYAMDIENYASGNSELCEKAFKLFFLELPDKAEPSALRTKLSDFRSLIFLLCDPVKGSSKNVPTEKRYNQKLACLLDNKRYEIILKQRVIDQSKHYRNCDTIVLNETNLSKIKLDELHTDNLKSLTLMNINVFKNLNLLRSSVMNINFANLTSLELSKCNISDIPEIVMKRLPECLESVVLQGNNIKSISKSISRMKCLRELNLSDNLELEDIGMPWNYLPKSLKILRIENIGITRVSASINRLEELELFKCGSDKLEFVSWQEISQSVTKLGVTSNLKLNDCLIQDKTNCTAFTLQCQGFTEFNDSNFPPNLNRLSLECKFDSVYFKNPFLLLNHLNLGNCKISENSRELLPSNLTSISIPKNKLKIIGNISHLSNLTEMNASENEIQWISEGITDLQFGTFKYFKKSNFFLSHRI